MKIILFFYALTFYSSSLLAKPYQLIDKDALYSESLSLVFDEVEKILPAKIFKEIGKDIYIDSYPYQKRTDFKNICDWENSTNFAGVSIWNFGKKVIRIDKNLLEFITQKNINTSFSCFKFHGNLKKLLMGLIIHETVHLYDLSMKKQKNKKYMRQVQVRGSNEEREETKEFTTIAKSNFYTNKFAWNRWGKSNKNKNPIRSADSYEFKNSTEHFAVNSEFYFLDPSFSCKRPFTARIFDRIYNLAKAKDIDCLNDIPIRMGAFGHSTIKVDQLIAIDYINVDEGDDVASSFGHSMIRLVICSEKRKVRSLECYKDISNHLALSFAANVTTKNIEVMKGVFGSYKSMLTITPFIKKRANII